MNDDDRLWGNTLLPVLVAAIGGFDQEVHGLIFHFEYGKYATVEIEHGCGSYLIRVLPLRGTNCVSESLGAPKGLQAITITVRKEQFVICECRYAPLALKVEGLVEALTLEVTA